MVDKHISAKFEREEVKIQTLHQQKASDSKIEMDAEYEEELYALNDSELFSESESMMLDEKDSDHLLDSSSDEDDLENGSDNQQKTTKDLKWIECQNGWQPTWLKPFEGPVSGPSSAVPKEMPNVLDYFTLYFDNEIIEHLVTETNRYAEQFFKKTPQKKQSSYYDSWNGCTASDIKCYLALLLHMGLCKMPRIECHWRSDALYNCPLCPNIMRKNEFMRLHKFFHAADNRNDTKQDKLFKIREVLNLLLKRYKKYYDLGKQITIDEKMIKFTGKITFRQHMPKKPTRFGFKVFLLCDAASGYIYNWKFYTGKDYGAESKNTAYSVVTELVNGLEGRGHHLFCDSYFSYMETVQQTAAKSIGYTGTVNKARLFLPDEIKNPKKLKRGESVFRRNGNTMVCVYKDRKEIRVVSNMHGNRRDNLRPQALNDYQTYMRGVDVSNQNCSYYHHEHKQLKWWKTLFIGVLEMTIANAHQIYQFRNRVFPLTQLRFRELLVAQLLETSMRDRQVYALHRERRIVMGMHELSRGNGQKNCGYCSSKKKRKKTSFYCKTCDVALCVTPCFYKYHTEVQISPRKKDKYKNHGK